MGPTRKWRGSNPYRKGGISNTPTVEKCISTLYFCIFFFWSCLGPFFFQIQHQHNRGRKGREEEEEDATTSSALINRCAGVATPTAFGGNQCRNPRGEKRAYKESKSQPKAHKTFHLRFVIIIIIIIISFFFKRLGNELG